MTLLLAKRPLAQITKVYHDPEIGIRIERGSSPHVNDIFPEGDDEPVFLRFKGRLAVTSSKGTYEGAARFVVTQFRIVGIIYSATNSKGLDYRRQEVGFFSVERSDLGPPQIIKATFGKIKRIEFRGVVDPLVFQALYLANLENFLEVMTPDYAKRLGHERRAEIAERQRAEKAKADQAAQVAAEGVRKENASRFGDERSPRTNPLGMATSVFDHLKTWRYRVVAQPGQCTAAFMAAFAGTGGIVMKAKWRVEKASDGALAFYEGRKGLIKLTTVLSQTASAEEQGAVGSEVRFKIEESGDDYTICAMWLASRATRIGFTNDGRFIRPYMRDVEDELRKLDPNLQVAKD